MVQKCILRSSKPLNQVYPPITETFLIEGFIFLIMNLRNFLKILFIYFWRERKGGRKREREKAWTSHTCPGILTGEQTLNPGMCPDWELNQRPFLCRMMPDQLSHTGQGKFFFFLNNGI